jgi:hypothetical protein
VRGILKSHLPVLTGSGNLTMSNSSILNAVRNLGINRTETKLIDFGMANGETCCMFRIFCRAVWGIELENSIDLILQKRVLQALPLLRACYIDGVDLTQIRPHHIPQEMKSATHALINIGHPQGFNLSLYLLIFSLLLS